MTEPSSAGVSGTPAELLPRFGARFIDGIILFIAGAILGVLFNYNALWLIVQAFGSFAYYALMDTYRGATIGKQLLHLRVVGPDGGLPTMQQAGIRESFTLLGIIPFLGFPLALVAAIVIAVTINSSPSKQGKHDEFAGGTAVLAVG
jgi:uncharacterized RDD family membrane protein YckC